MRVIRILLLSLAAVSLLVMAACSDNNYSARFVRYDTLPNGTRVAIVAPQGQGADPGEIVASTTLEDLQPGERVMIEDLGKDWDQPQWMPSEQIVERADSTSGPQ